MILALLNLIVATTSALNILMIAPTLSYSHISFNAKIAEDLTSKGHKVVMLVPDIDSEVPNPVGSFEVVRGDVGLDPRAFASTLWTNPGPYEDSSPLNLWIFVKLLRVSSLFVRACGDLFAPFGDEMSFLNRAQNVLISAVTALVFSYSRAQQSRIFWKTDLFATARSSDSVLVNTLPMLDFAMPTSNKIAYIGGFTAQKEPKRMDTFWQQLADSSSRGFILVTFGSIAKTMDMPLEMQDKFFTAFSQFPEITFIIKYETTNCTLRIPPNVQFTRWIPQAELMDHGKNSKVVEAKGAALILDKMNLKVSDITKAIAEVTSKPRYREACINLSRMMDDASPLKSADLLDYQVRRAAKASRKKFPSTPRESQRFPVNACIEIFIGISIAIVTTAS
ncbi:hypothetical protein NECAME_03574 [Necator americanus]|uniref:glucuronosyltransferase n=1 Tax=Necator americanus TaxID=51031 RepID=W2T282_NECAM|nr:hypothetical protein NECAME_03574 [Necator americanus]ETN76008.1 hypothetical protein NECAME_03574 [Necator americanus]